jgi:glycosyltransferase involved in cell wall biosynthesis
MGWGWVSALGKLHNLCVIVIDRKEYRDSIERELAKDRAIRTRFYFVPWPEGQMLSFMPHPFSLWYLRYNQWHRQALELARTLNESEKFDVAHQLNMIGYHEPGYLWQLDLPFVWGPVGGTPNTRLQLLRDVGAAAWFTEATQSFVNTSILLLSRRIRRVVRRTNVLVTATSDIQEDFRRALGADSVMINEIGANSELLKNSTGPNFKAVPLRLVWSGWHLARKALPILLRALALLPSGFEYHLDVLGEERRLTQRWRRLADELGVGSHCTWHGHLPHAIALDIMKQSHLFCLTSLREATTNVVPEALSAGVPVICFDHCGQGDVVDDTCGIKIFPGQRAQVYRDFSNAIVKLGTDRVLLQDLSVGAKKRARQMTWDSKAAQMSEIYEVAIRRYKLAKNNGR